VGITADRPEFVQFFACVRETLFVWKFVPLNADVLWVWRWRLRKIRGGVSSPSVCSWGDASPGDEGDGIHSLVDFMCARDASDVRLWGRHRAQIGRFGGQV
jgi:hypothetical protein